MGFSRSVSLQTAIQANGYRLFPMQDLLLLNTPAFLDAQGILLYTSNLGGWSSFWNLAKLKTVDFKGNLRKLFFKLWFAGRLGWQGFHLKFFQFFGVLGPEGGHLAV